MKIIFNIKNETIEKNYDLTITIFNIKKELLNEYYNNKCKYLDFELILENPIKHFGKLSLEPGLIPSSMDKFKLNKFSINELNQLTINVLENNTNDILQNIEKPDDDLIFALILKNLSDRQISLNKKLINYIIKRIDRSYSKIFEFIYKIDQLSLKKKKPINFKTIKEIL